MTKNFSLVWQAAKHSTPLSAAALTGTKKKLGAFDFSLLETEESGKNF